MKFLLLIFSIFSLSISNVYSNLVELANDNGSPRAGHQTPSGWAENETYEESAMLSPDGPCSFKEIKIYYTGDEPGLDTIYVAGDPSEGAIPPTGWVWDYNLLIDPIIIEYDGNPGWVSIPVSNLRSDGFDRIWIQHSTGKNGPWFAADDNSQTQPYTSYMMNPFKTNSLGGPGNYYLATGDYMVRSIIEYTYPDNNTSQPAPAPLFLDVSVEAGLTDDSGNPLRSAMASAPDWNNDGFADLAIGSRFFENNGDGTYSNVSSRFGFNCFATVWADVDNDGNLDAFSARGSGNDKMYWGNGDGTFTEQTDPDIVKDAPTVTPIWLDYNNDGLLDLFIAYGRSGSYPNEVFYQDKLFKNLGNREFEDVTSSSGIAAGEPSPYYDCWGASVCDYNDDGWPDIFVATYRLAPDLLYKNNGDGTFTEVGAETGARGVPTQQANYFGHGMGSDWADYNNDGYMDLAIGNLGHPDWRGAVSNPSMIMKNNGPDDYSFTNVKEELGLKFFEMNAGMVWADFDNDGFQDLYHCQYSYDRRGDGVDRLSRLYMNSGADNDFRLRDKTWEYGPVIHGAWAPIRLDYDLDGDMDLLVASSQEYVKLFRNDIPRENSYLEIIPSNQFLNDGSGVNASGYGAKARLAANNGELVRWLPGSVMNGRAAQSSDMIHFGTGRDNAIHNLYFTVNDEQTTLRTTKGLKSNICIRLDTNGNIKRVKTAVGLLSPKNFAYGKTSSVTLEWQFVPDAVNYTVSLAKDNPENVIETIETSEFPTFDELEDGVYFWKVIPEYDNIGNNNPEHWSSTWQFTVGMPAPGAPELNRPENNETDVTVIPEMNWSDVRYNVDFGYKTMFHIQLALDENFTEIVEDQENIKNFIFKITDSLDANTRYYWRVRAVNTINAERPAYGPWSDTWSFMTLAVPGIPVLLEPGNGATEVKIRAKLQWEDVDNADFYEVWASTDSEFNNIVYEKTGISLARTTIFSELEGSTTYYWKVRAHNAAGPGEISETWSFTTEIDTDVPQTFEEGFGIISISPLPFNYRTVIAINIPRDEFSSIEIMDVFGNTVYTVVSGSMTAGDHKFSWIPENVSSGVYFVKLRSGRFVQTEKVIYQD